MEAVEVRQLVEKFEEGQPVDNFDLQILLAQFSTLIRALEAMPLRYHLALTDARARLAQLERMKAERDADELPAGA